MADELVDLDNRRLALDFKLGEDASSAPLARRPAAHQRPRDRRGG